MVQGASIESTLREPNALATLVVDGLDRWIIALNGLDV
jgi:hypothetical protein